jgi:DNA-binding GntR family transcriptional regulator
MTFPARDPERPQSLTDSAYATLLDMILDGRLAGGTIIEERLLTEDLGISRTPLREALGRLEGERFIRRQGRRLVVHRLSERELVQILHMRRVLEAEAAALAAGRLPADELQALRAAHAIFTAPAGQPRDAFWQLDTRLHGAIGRASGNTMMADAILDLRRRTKPYGMDIPPHRYAAVCEEHLAILDAIEQDDADAARSAMLVHLDAARQDLISKISAI